MPAKDLGRCTYKDPLLFLIAVLGFLQGMMGKGAFLVAQEERISQRTVQREVTQEGIRLWGEGSFTALVFWQDPLHKGWDSPRGGSLCTSTLNLTGGRQDSAQVFATGRLTLLYGDLAAQAWMLQGQSERAGYLPYITAELSRLFLALYTEWGDLSVGRMIVNWGRGRSLSPTDLLTSAFLEGTNLSRHGTDVVRWTIPLGALSNVDMVYTLLPPMAEGYGAAHLKGNVGGWEMGLLTGYDGGALEKLHQNQSFLGDSLLLGTVPAGGSIPSGSFPAKALLLGGDIQGDLLVGLVGEGMLRLPLTEEPLSWEKVSYSFMGGINYSLGDLLFNLEYQVAGGPSYPWSGFWSRQLGFAQLSYTCTESFQTAVVGLFEPGTSEYFVQVSFRYALQRGVSLIGYAHYQMGIPGNGGAEGIHVVTLGSQVSVRF